MANWSFCYKEKALQSFTMVVSDLSFLDQIKLKMTTFIVLFVILHRKSSSTIELSRCFFMYLFKGMPYTGKVFCYTGHNVFN